MEFITFSIFGKFNKYFFVNPTWVQDCFELNRVVINRHVVFICKGYISDGLFKLSLMPLSINKISSIFSFVANVECSDM